MIKPLNKRDVKKRWLGTRRRWCVCPGLRLCLVNVGNRTNQRGLFCNGRLVESQATVSIFSVVDKGVHSASDDELQIKKSIKTTGWLVFPPKLKDI